LSPVKKDPTRTQLLFSEGRPLQQSLLSKTTDLPTFHVDADLSLSQARYTKLYRSDPILSSYGDLEVPDEEEEKEHVKGEGEKTVAERRAEKRKEKRFRYEETHES
jgi:hypothetical protein